MYPVSASKLLRFGKHEYKIVHCHNSKTHVKKSYHCINEQSEQVKTWEVSSFPSEKLRKDTNIFSLPDASLMLGKELKMEPYPLLLSLAVN